MNRSFIVETMISVLHSLIMLCSCRSLYIANSLI